MIEYQASGRLIAREQTGTYLDRGFQLEQYGLGNEDLARLGAEKTNLGFQQLHLFARSAPSHLQQPIDDGIEIDIILVRHLTDLKTGRGSVKSLPSCLPDCVDSLRNL